MGAQAWRQFVMQEAPNPIFEWIEQVMEKVGPWHFTHDLRPDGVRGQDKCEA